MHLSLSHVVQEGGHELCYFPGEPEESEGNPKNCDGFILIKPLRSECHRGFWLTVVGDATRHEVTVRSRGIHQPIELRLGIFEGFAARLILDFEERSKEKNHQIEALMKDKETLEEAKVDLQKENRELKALVQDLQLRQVTPQVGNGQCQSDEIVIIDGGVDDMQQSSFFPQHHVNQHQNQEQGPVHEAVREAGEGAQSEAGAANLRGLENPIGAMQPGGAPSAAEGTRKRRSNQATNRCYVNLKPLQPEIKDMFKLPNYEDYGTRKNWFRIEEKLSKGLRNELESKGWKREWTHFHAFFFLARNKEALLLMPYLQDGIFSEIKDQAFVIDSDNMVYKRLKYTQKMEYADQNRWGRDFVISWSDGLPSKTRCELGPALEKLKESFNYK